MNNFMKDAKKKIRNIIGILSILILIAVLIIISFWGKDIYALLQGPESFQDIETSMMESEENTIEQMQMLDHKYMRSEVEMIIGSYAEYGKQIDKEMDVDKTYYLMPVRQGTYFITIIGDQESMSRLNEMEADFLNSVGMEGKTYPEPLPIEGGFLPLDEEAKAYAFEYFQGYDENVVEMDQLSNILSPYAIEIGAIGGTRIESLYMLYYTCITLLILLVVLLFLYVSNIFLYILKRDMKAVADHDKDSINKDYKDAKEMNGLMYGELMLYKKSGYRYRIWAYENIIWLYKKEKVKHNKVEYELIAYDKAGKKHTLLRDPKKKSIEKCLNKIFDHCDQTILGYQKVLEDAVKDDAHKLYEVVKELKDTKIEAKTTLVKKDKVVEKDKVKN